MSVKAPSGVGTRAQRICEGWRIALGEDVRARLVSGSNGPATEDDEQTKASNEQGPDFGLRDNRQHPGALAEVVIRAAKGARPLVAAGVGEAGDIEGTAEGLVERANVNDCPRVARRGARATEIEDESSRSGESCRHHCIRLLVPETPITKLIEPLAPRVKVPSATETSPVKVFVPLNVRVPAPTFSKPEAPETFPLTMVELAPPISRLLPMRLTSPPTVAVDAPSLTSRAAPCWSVISSVPTSKPLRSSVEVACTNVPLPVVPRAAALLTTRVPPGRTTVVPVWALTPERRSVPFSRDWTDSMDDPMLPLTVSCDPVPPARRFAEPAAAVMPSAPRGRRRAGVADEGGLVISDGGGLRDVVAIHVEGHAGVEKINVGVGAKGVGVGHLNGRSGSAADFSLSRERIVAADDEIAARRVELNRARRTGDD